jgi:hypothetical protein
MSIKQAYDAWAGQYGVADPETDPFQVIQFTFHAFN